MTPRQGPLKGVNMYGWGLNVEWVEREGVKICSDTTDDDTYDNDTDTIQKQAVAKEAPLANKPQTQFIRR